LDFVVLTFVVRVGIKIEVVRLVTIMLLFFGLDIQVRMKSGQTIRLIPNIYESSSIAITGGG
jgi:hypothetical protein